MHKARNVLLYLVYLALLIALCVIIALAWRSRQDEVKPPSKSQQSQNDQQQSDKNASKPSDNSKQQQDNSKQTQQSQKSDNSKQQTQGSAPKSNGSKPGQPAAPSQPSAPKPGQTSGQTAQNLANSGPGDVVGLFAVAVAGGTAGFSMYQRRRLTRS